MVADKRHHRWINQNVQDVPTVFEEAHKIWEHDKNLVRHQEQANEIQRHGEVEFLFLPYRVYRDEYEVNGVNKGVPKEKQSIFIEE